jgi:membrane protein required for colicin V production
MNGIAVIDLVFAALIIILMVRCALRGFVGEVLSMAAVVLGVLTAILLYKNGAAFIRTEIISDVRILPEVLAFIVLFLIVFLLIKILESLLNDIIGRIRLVGADRFLGLLFGLVEGITLVALMLFVLVMQPLFNPEPVLRGSLFAELLLPLISLPGTAGHV